MKLNKHLLHWLALTLLFGSQIFHTALAAGADPAAPGPYAVTTTEYNFGDLAFTPTGFPSSVEVRSAVYYPTSLSGGPFPLVVLMHGRHVTCYLGTSAVLQWPCTSGRVTIPSFQGYDYIGQTLASHGYIVISVSANGINAFDNSVFDLGMIARGELIQHHLGLWQMFNTTGDITGVTDFGTLFVGKVDMNNIGTFGHSRGGEGVVRHYVINQTAGSPYGIKAVLPLAPVDFNRPVINNVALNVIMPYCDGDVSDLQGVHFFDDALYNVPGDNTAKHTVLVMGANHNYFNKIWTPGLFPAGTIDDWAFVSGGSTDPHCGPTMPTTGRLTPTQQRGVGLAYTLAFFRTYLGGETAFQSILAGDEPPPASAMTDQLHVSYHAPDNAATRRDVNRLLDASSLVTNTLGGAVTQSGLIPYEMCGGPLPQPRHCLAQSTSRQPHTTVSARASSLTGLPQLKMGWNSTTDNVENNLPAGTRDVSGYFALSFRASVNFEDVRNPSGLPQDFSVTVTDGLGNTSTAKVSDWSNSLFFPPGTTGPVPKVFLNTIRVPLFAFSGVNKQNISSVRFNFDQTTGGGALLISDIAFADGFTGSDFDGDGIPDITDNCPKVGNPSQTDDDGDGIGNACDNCLAVANPVQRDTDHDGFGNYCDPDFDNNGVVNPSDLFYLKSKFLSSDPNADLNGDGIVNAADLFILKTMFLGAPGPSGP